MSYFDIKIIRNHGSYAMYDPTDPAMTLTDVKLSMAFGEAGSLDFTMGPDHLYYGQIVPFGSTIAVYEDGDMIFLGRPLYPHTDIYGRKTYHCEGALAFFNDVILPPTVAAQYATPDRRFINMLNYYNRFVGENRYMYYDGDPLPGESYDYTYDYKTCKEGLQNILDVIGGYFYVEPSVSGHHELKWVEEPPASVLAPIEVGLNMQDMGAEGKEYYTAAIATGAEINGNVVHMVDPVISESAGTYGFICTRLEFPDAQTVGELETRCAAWLASQIFHEQRVDVTALDLHLVKNDYNAFLVGRGAHVVNRAIGLNAVLPIMSLDIDINTGRKTVGLGGSVLYSLTRPRKVISSSSNPVYLTDSNGNRYIPYVDNSGNVGAQKAPDYIEFTKKYDGPYYVGDKIQLEMYRVTAFFGDDTTEDWTWIMQYSPPNGYVFLSSGNPESFAATRILRMRTFQTSCLLNFAGERPGPALESIPTPIARWQKGGIASVSVIEQIDGVTYQLTEIYTLPDDVYIMFIGVPADSQDTFTEPYMMHRYIAAKRSVTISARRIVTDVNASEDVEDRTVTFSTHASGTFDGKTVYLVDGQIQYGGHGYTSVSQSTPENYSVNDVQKFARDITNGELAWVLVYGGYTE